MDHTDSMDSADVPDRTGLADVPDTSDRSDSADRSMLSMLSVAEAAARLGVNERSVRRYIKRGVLDAERRPTERHTMELRIAPAALADFQGRQEAIAHDPTPTEAPPTGTDRDADRAPDRSGRAPAVRSEVSAALGQAIQTAVQAAVAPLADELRTARERNEALATELGRERATNEALQAQLSALERRQARRRPWYLRLLLGR